MLAAPRKFIASHLGPFAHLIVSTFAALLLAGLAPAQEQEPDPTAEQIQERRAAIEADNNLDEAVRSAALAELQMALDALSRAADAKATAARYRLETETAPAELERVRAALAQPTAPPEIEVEQQWTAADVAERRDRAQTEATDAEGNLTGLTARARRRSERDAALEADREAARANLTRIAADLENPLEQPHPALSDAVRWRLLAERVEANAVVDQLAAERRRNAAERELMPLRVDLARQRRTVARAALGSWEEALREQRRVEAGRADEAAADARRELATRFPTLRQVVDEIERFAAQHSGPDGVIAKRDTVREQQAIIEQMLERTRKSYAAARARYLAGGLSAAFGPFLRLEYDRLPNRRQLRTQARQLTSDISDATIQAIILRESRRELGEVGTRVAEFLGRVPPSESAAERAQLEQAAIELFGVRRDVLGLLSTEYDPYVRELLRLDSATDQLLAVTGSYEDFIGEHILWVRSVDKPFELNSRALRGGALWLLRGDPERPELDSLGRDVAQLWPLWVLLAVMFTVALAARQACMKRIETAAPLVQRHKNDALSLTARVLGWTLVAALPYPLLVFGVGQIVGQNIGDSTWRLGWATVFDRLALVLLSFSVLLQILRPNGLARAHFRWPESPCVALTALARRYAIPAVIFGAAPVLLEYAGDPAYSESAGRLLGLVSAALWGVFSWRVLTPKGPVLAPFYARHSDSLITRLRRPIFLLGVGIPVAIIVATVIGYYFTARVFAGCLLLTSILALALLLFHGLSMRWLFFHRRRLAVHEALRRRKEKEEQQAVEGAATEPEVDADENVDIPALDAHTRTLFRAAVVVALVFGLLSIWSPLLPALKALERVQLLPSVRMLSVAETEAAPPVQPVQPVAVADSAEATPDTPAAGRAPSIPGMPPLTATVPAEVAAETSDYSLTLADVLTALVLGIVAIVIVRHVPALLEIGVLTRLSIDAGARYAIATIVRYSLIGVGVALTFGALGIGWSSIQWLAAALTFGLAFGLQEIFANFISGLILLVERPIRVGDTVTIGTLTGTVARIRTRATTIRDFDNRERLIPNKTLITDEVTNWTLSDTVTRVVIDVGVAYGSDTRKVVENLMRAATECPVTMANPKPSVLFKGFGESALDFAIRFYIPARSHWVEAMNYMHTRIDDLFRDADIEIAFPQRDLHLRSVDAELKVSSEEGAASP